MAKKILAVVAVAVVLFLAVVATRPPAFHVERSVSMTAPPSAAFAQVNDFHAWVGWSPWEKMDPGMKKTFEGAAAGAGAVYSWAGNDKVGEGRMTIEQSDPDRRIVIKLEFLKPFAATNTATFTFGTEGSGTKVTWAMDGKNSFIAKAFSMFMDMDHLIGADFERGLTSMKQLAEATAKAQPSAAP